MKTILVPADFTSNTIKVAQEAVQAFECDIRLLFVHAFNMPDSEQDLLFGSYRNENRKYVSPEFLKELEDLKDVFSYKVKNVIVDFFYGTTPMLFSSYLDYYDVSLIVYSSEQSFGDLSANSVDMRTLIRQSECKSVDIDSSAIFQSLSTPFARI
ncbi:MULTISPECIES: hypothetical protein [unclassified Imperialibacter]|uniref:hypothetical protein n=1 Tax=unclassified Imperialibacter TaxID=2629706 RepID=UPI0012549227|nr:MULTISPECIES: hypothetical protein [unclassified Imperialibacter]CAD5250392.1 conserved hypothetical protein [Imperialibacter sp. 75]CAD5287119.1 conserved hypothetical protein [Imperialibacter sp. 89]VVT06067.1 conserved hypothetical protein [Imperialibacter sp. EC-SDR9]